MESLGQPTLKQKMSDSCTSGALIYTFDGFYGNLSRVGLPTPLVATLQSESLTLESALWNMRCSGTGLYICEFVLAYWKCEERVEEETTLMETQSKSCR